MGKIPKDSWAIIERVIRRYPESKKEYEDRYKDFVLKKGDGLLFGGSSSSCVGNPTENIALKLTNPRMERLHREIEAVEAIYDVFPPKHQKVITLRFWADRYRNMPYLKMEQCIDYKEGQMKRIVQKFVRNVGKKLGEI